MPELRVAVIADTHIPRRAVDLPPAAWARIDACDLVLHAGDVVEEALLRRIADHRPVHAVRGNNDSDLSSLPEVRELDLAGVAVAMVHDSGPAVGRRARMRRRFPGARVVVFGHSHIPVADDEGGLLLLNPGSPTDRRRMPTFTMAELALRDGRLEAAELVDLGLDRAASRP